MLEINRNENIELLSYSEVKKIEGPVKIAENQMILIIKDQNGESALIGDLKRVEGNNLL